MSATVGGIAGIPEVGGDPDALEYAAAECRGIAGSFERIGGQMRVAGLPPGWSGVAAVSFAGRAATDADMIETGTGAFASAARVYGDMADALRGLRRDVRHLEERAERAERDARTHASAADEADQQAASARVRSDLAARAADIGELTASPSAASHRQEQALQLAAATSAADRAATHRRVAADRAAELHDAQATAGRKIAHYKKLAAEAGSTLETLAALAPHVDTVYGRPVATVDSPGAPGKTDPVIPRPAPPPTHEDENFLDGIRQGAGGLVDTVKGVNGLAKLTGPPSLDEMRDPKRAFDDRRKTVEGAWDVSMVVVSHPIETAKNMTYRPYTDAYRQGGWDKLVGIGTFDALVAIGTGGAGKAASGIKHADGALRARIADRIEVGDLDRKYPGARIPKDPGLRASLDDHGPLAPHEHYRPFQGDLALGTRIDTLAQKGKLAVLDLDAWSPYKNWEWTQIAADYRATAVQVSERSPANLWDTEANRPRVFALEREWFFERGYSESGARLSPPPLPR